MGMRAFIPVPRCKNCDKPIKLPRRNKSGYCSNCSNRISKGYDKSKRERRKRRCPACNRKCTGKFCRKCHFEILNRKNTYLGDKEK